MRRRRDHGFTLLELSIVILIIALIVGGILVGNSLIRSSELQSVIADVSRLQDSIAMFKTKYNGLPGDLITAEAIWGSDTSCPNTPTNTVPKVATCNGNGDGMIASWNYVTGVLGANETESFRAWQQLSDAGFIPGAFTGVTGAAGAFNPAPGANSPQPSYRGAAYSLFWLYNPTGGGGSGTYAHTPDHVITLGAATASTGSASAFLTPQEALQIDGKVDDGLPGLGNVIGPTGTPNCTTTDVPGTALYNVASTGRACWLYFHLGF